jgi:hypothetical protein
VPNTIKPPKFDRQDWDAVQVLIAEVQQAERMTVRYAAGVLLFDAAVRSFRNVERVQLFEKTPSEDDLKFHEAILHSLISLGQLLAMRIAKIDAEDLAPYGIKRENLWAYVEELRDTFVMWHGPELNPERAAELKKAIFGALA